MRFHKLEELREIALEYKRDKLLWVGLSGEGPGVVPIHDRLADTEAAQNGACNVSAQRSSSWYPREREQEIRQQQPTHHVGGGAELVHLHGSI